VSGPAESGVSRARGKLYPKRLSRFLLLGSLTLCTTDAAAADTVQGEAPRHLTGPSLAEDTTATVTVITRDQIEAQRTDSVTEMEPRRITRSS
jgi:outer membrane receptor protein involved in Fe transport